MNVPVLSGGWPLLGHLPQLRKRPIELFWRVREACGEVGELHFAGNRIVLLTGVEAQEAFFRGSDEQLDPAVAYPFMTPVFGRGVVFDATPEQRKQALRDQSLRESAMREHAEVIAHETERMMAKLGERGEIDLLDFFSELTIYTSSACRIGKHFCEELTPESFRVFCELEKGTDALAYVNPYLPLPVFRARDRARRRMVERLSGVFERRARALGDIVEELDALRLHPPLILLMRKVVHDFQYKDWTIPAGKLVAVSPAVSNRMPECFPDPDCYDPERYAKDRAEDQQLFAWIPFGGGRHRCVGAPFAMMQRKAIFSTLLRTYTFELSHPPASHRNDHSKMVVQLAQPCRVRYRRRDCLPEAS